MEKTFQGVLRVCQRAAVAVIAVTCLAAAYYTVRFAYAEYLFRSGAKEKVDRAAALVPLRAEYQARAGDLERAVRLNPYSSSAWMELGLRAEAEGHLAKGEAALLEAAHVDKTFEPRWTLANFYFRRNNWDEFWKWIRASAEMSYGDRSALFRLCWAASQNPDEILAKAIPSNPSVLGDYLDYLTRSNRFEAAESAAQRLLTAGQPSDTARLLTFCDQLLDTAHRPEGALHLWNGMIGRGWLPYRRLDPDSGSSLTNGDFAISPLSHGFDWRLLNRAIVHTVWTDSPRGLLISFDGKQDESLDILEQWLPLLPSTSYELSVRAESGDIPRDSGLRWRIAGDGLDALGGTLQFTTSAQTAAARLILSYQRAPGTSRIEGKLRLVSVNLERHGPRMNTDKHR